MAQFTLSWDNTEVLASGNSLEQMISYRQKTIGDPWIITGFTPPNPLSVIDDTAESPVLSANVVYEFKVENTCSEGGPTPNDNGIVEVIGFSCITPDIQKTHINTTAIVDLTNTDITRVRFTLRKSSDNSIIYGPISINNVGGSAQTTATGLTAATSYYWQTVLYANLNGVEVLSSSVDQLNSVCGPFTFSTDAAPVQDLQWLALLKQCEKEGGFGVVKTITGLSSPYKTWYDEVNELVYVADQDDAAGNVYWFNHNSATLPAHMVHSSAVIDPLLYNAYIDSVHRRIYFVGANTNGLRVYDIDTDIASTVAYGTNGAFRRTLLTVTGNNIYCNDGTTSIIIINRTTLAISSTVTIASIPTPSHFAGGVISLVPVGATELYAITSNGAEPKVGVYNLTLTSLIAEITLTGVATWDFGAYWQNGFYDDTSNQVYIGDIGSSKLFVIDEATKAISATITAINKQGKTNVQHAGLINPTTNNLYIAYSALNSSADGSPINRLYLIDRTLHSYINMYETQYYVDVAAIAGTSKVIGASPGLGSWSGGGFATDGSITIVSNAVGAENTGDELTITLQEVDANNGNLPTGNTKNNIPSDPDYIAPEQDFVACPLTETLICPTDLVTTFLGGTLQYEFAIPSSVKNNVNILKIEVYAYNIDTASPEGVAVVINSPSDNYYSGNFTGLGGTNYTIQIRYLGTSDSVLQTC